MILIIAEKPALGKAIAAALPGHGTMKDSCIYQGDYVVTWLFGHMLSLKEPEDYDKSYKKWSVESLPIFFENWQTKISRDSAGRISKKDRVNQIGGLLKQADMVIHAGDPDDEGQLLVDEILDWFRYKGPVKRLDTANTTEAAMRKALNHMSDNSLHVNAGQSAYARSVADLMVGVNMSRFYLQQSESAADGRTCTDSDSRIGCKQRLPNRASRQENILQCSCGFKRKQHRGNG